jgi:hypothetical protein
MPLKGFRFTWSPFRFFWAFGNLLWIPICFLNFDPLHDGTILATINQLKISFLSGGDWPFNQYGSTWAFPYLAVSYLVPPEFLLFTLRLVTVLFYIGSSYYLYKVAYFVYGLRVARISVYLYLALQPFLGSWNTSLLPWPSSIVTLLVPMVLYLLLKSTDAVGKESRKYLVSLGVLCGFITGSRIQVGIVLVTVISLFLAYYLFSEAKYLWIGLFCWFGPWSIFLYANGWLKDSLYDSIILASQFLGSDRLHYPLPLLSLLSGLFLAALVVIMGRRQLQLKYLFLILLFLASLAVYFAMRVLGDSSTAINITSVIQRKLLAAVFFGALLLLVFECIELIRTRGVARNRVSESSLRKIALYLISVSAATQAWPFFDQMHIWWSISPLLAVFSARIAVLNVTKFNLPTKGILVVTTMIMAILVSSQFATKRVELKSINQKLIYVDETSERSEADVQMFLHKNLPLGSKILNLCPNAYPFFRAGEYETNSRFFVYWSNFESAPLEYKDYSPSVVKNVLVCETYLYEGEALQKYRERQRAILSEMLGIKLIDELRNGSFRWQFFTTESPPELE